MEDKKELKEEQAEKVSGGEGEDELTPEQIKQINQIKKILGGGGGGSGKQQPLGGGGGDGALQ